MIKQHVAEGPVGVVVCRDWFVPKVIERILCSESRHIVDGPAQGLDRAAMIEGRGGHGAVDCNKAASSPQEGGKVSAVNKEDALGNAVLVGETWDLAVARFQVVVQGVTFHDQMCLQGGRSRKRREDNLQKLADVVEVRVLHDLGIAVQLQGHEKKGFLRSEKALEDLPMPAPFPQRVAPEDAA